MSRWCREKQAQQGQGRAAPRRPPPPDPKKTSRTQGLRDVCARSEDPPSRETATIVVLLAKGETACGGASPTTGSASSIDTVLCLIPDILLSLVTRCCVRGSDRRGACVQGGRQRIRIGPHRFGLPAGSFVRSVVAPVLPYQERAGAVGARRLLT
jgi:hypothetical protein